MIWKEANKMVCNGDSHEQNLCLDEELLNLFKHFKEINEQEAQEKLSNEDLIVDFCNLISEKISKLVDDSDL